MAKATKEELKRTLREGLTKFRGLLEGVPADQLDGRAEIIAQDWQLLIDNDAALGRLAEVDNMSSVVAIASKISNRQNYDQLVATVRERFSEVDLLVHAGREWQGAEIEKLPEGTAPQADFLIGTAIPTIAESKYCQSPSPNRLREVITQAATQIDATAASKNLKEYRGVIWVFSYQYPRNHTTMETQSLVAQIAADVRSIRTYELVVDFQVYGHGLAGDAHF